MSTENKDIEVTDEELKKALEVLGLNEEVGDEIEKSEKSKEGSDKEDEKEKEDDIEKANSELEDLKKTYEMKKSEVEAKMSKKKPEDKVEKSQSMVDNDLIKSLQETLSNKIEESAKAFGTLYKSLKSENDILAKSLKSSLEEISKLREFSIALGNQSLGRKSAPTAKAIEKSMGDDELNGKTVYSLSRDKAKIEEVLFDLSGIEKGDTINQLYANEAVHVNTSGHISKAVEDDLFKNHNIKIVQ